MKRLNRRQFLKVLGAGVTATSFGMPQVFLNTAHAQAGRKFLNIFLEGGCDMFITLEPSGFGAVMDRLRLNRPTLGYPLLDDMGRPYPRLALNGSNYTLHDQLTELQFLFNRTPRQCAVLIKAGVTSNNSGSHAEAQKDFHTGVVSGTDIDNTGWMQKIAEAYEFSSPYNVMDLTSGRLSTGATAVSAEFRPMAITSFPDFGFVPAFGAAAGGEYGFRMATSMSVIEKASPSPLNNLLKDNWSQIDHISSTVRAAYEAEAPLLDPMFPATPIGAQLRDAFIGFQQLPARFCYTEMGGFDLHGNTDPSGQSSTTRQGMSALLGDLNAALSAFRQNCERVGIWQDMIVGITTEFGRTSKQNTRGGLDHADASVAFLLGGAVNGGIYGEDFNVGELTRVQNAIEAQIKVRDIYCDVIQGMALNPALVFPGFVRSPLGVIKAV